MPQIKPERPKEERVLEEKFLVFHTLTSNIRVYSLCFAGSLGDIMKPQTGDIQALTSSLYADPTLEGYHFYLYA